MSGFLERLTSWLDGGAPADRAWSGERPTTEPGATSPAPSPPSSADPNPPEPHVTPDDARLPDTSRPKIARLVALMAEIEERSENDALLVSALTEVRQMRDVHLPQLVASYAEIPPTHRKEIFRKTGHSASYNLNEAFDRMIARLESLSATLAQEDLDSFSNNLRFIEQRYGRDEGLG